MHLFQHGPSNPTAGHLILSLCITSNIDLLIPPLCISSSVVLLIPLMGISYKRFASHPIYGHLIQAICISSNNSLSQRWASNPSEVHPFQCSPSHPNAGDFVPPLRIFSIINLLIPTLGISSTVVRHFQDSPDHPTVGHLSFHY